MLQRNVKGTRKQRRRFVSSTVAAVPSKVLPFQHVSPENHLTTDSNEYDSQPTARRHAPVVRIAFSSQPQQSLLSESEIAQVLKIVGMKFPGKERWKTHDGLIGMIERFEVARRNPGFQVGGIEGRNVLKAYKKYSDIKASHLSSQEEDQLAMLPSSKKRLSVKRQAAMSQEAVHSFDITTPIVLDESSVEEEHTLEEPSSAVSEPSTSQVYHEEEASPVSSSTMLIPSGSLGKPEAMVEFVKQLRGKFLSLAATLEHASSEMEISIDEGKISDATVAAMDKWDSESQELFRHLAQIASRSEWIRDRFRQVSPPH
jgi:hypothetical protein